MEYSFYESIIMLLYFILVISIYNGCYFRIVESMIPDQEERKSLLEPKKLSEMDIDVEA
jgi:uncharacterized membrane protein